MFSSPDEVKKFIEKEGVEFIDVRFTDLPGQQQHFNVPAATLPDDFFTEGVDVRRLVDPRVRRDPQVGHEADPGPGDRLRRPVPRGQDAQRRVLDRRAAHRRALRARPAPGGGEGRGVAEVDRHRRHRLLRSRGRVLRLRRRALPDRRRTRVSTTSTRSRAPGTPAASRTAATAVTRPATRAATSPCRRSTTTPTCATR